MTAGSVTVPTIASALQLRRGRLAVALRALRERTAQFDALALPSALVQELAETLEAGRRVTTGRSPLDTLLLDDVRDHLRDALTNRTLPRSVRRDVFDVLVEVGFLYGPLGDATEPTPL